MKREYLLLTLLPLFSYANAAPHRSHSYEAVWDEEASDLLVADAMNPGMQGQNMQGNMQNPDAFQLYVKDQGFFCGAEFLYWTVKEGTSLEYAFVKNIPSYLPAVGMSAGNGLIGDAVMAKFDWNPGFRLNAGYQIGHDNWELLANYTYFQTEGTNHATRPESLAVQPGTTPPEFIAQLLPAFPNQLTTFQSVTRIKSHIRFTENVLDLKLEKHFAPSRFLTMGFAVGYEGGWFEQRWRMKAHTFPSVGVISVNKLNWNFSGAGPLIGLDSSWYLTKSFTLFLDAMASVLYGYHREHVVTTNSAGLVFDTFQNMHAKDHRFVPHTMLEIGLAWDYRFTRSFINIYAGYEINSWFNMHQTYDYHDNGNNNPGSDVSYSVDVDPVNTHGLTFGVEYHF